MLVFFIGTGRCGSTPVVEVVSRHRDVGFVSNFDDKLSQLNMAGRWNNALHRLSPPRDPRLRPFRDRRKLIELGRFRVAPSEGWRILDRQVAPVISMPFRDLLAEDCTPWLQGRLTGFFERRMAVQGRRTFVHHFTGWPRTGMLHAAFPGAKFVEVVRDGRAVANSWLQMGWWQGYRGPDAWHLGPLPAPYAQEWEYSGRSFVTLAGLGWKLLIDAFDSAGALIPESQWLRVRYEDVIAEPRRHLAGILDFSELEWTDDFERAFVEYPFVSSRIDSFRKDLDHANIRLLESSLAPTLRALGYPVDAHVMSPALR
ncbi:MAG: sulfotransferase [Candidatus Dormibacteraeota bacterium]|nr:sulfotransferase [Candidatus Dormibacteraeota bacterium]